MATKFDISAPVEKLMSIIAILEALDCEEPNPQRQELLRMMELQRP